MLRLTLVLLLPAIVWAGWTLIPVHRIPETHCTENWNLPSDMARKYRILAVSQANLMLKDVDAVYGNAGRIKRQLTRALSWLGVPSSIFDAEPKDEITTYGLLANEVQNEFLLRLYLMRGIGANACLIGEFVPDRRHDSATVARMKLGAVVELVGNWR